ncbi:RNA polymerase II elongator complex subunit [Penicillium ucsense]|uniref:Elongator complex protein 4 n=1 Tax=Penicillium ucsense TaxID=2839758 RepID=A0A8J8VWH9_9EURO|nr:RNA polymerase II elongator complex subunit [Penicillium ucsense]KAF7729073.1 RNA polymerase II elongator complex subunit [Penicillium ucsense]
MSFRKRNVGLSTGADRSAAVSSQSAPIEPSPGIRPSPDDGRPTTSTGAPSLDNLLAGHAGLPMGKTILIEENGTTDFAGALLRYYAAEGVVQEQKIHVVGVPEQWGRSLPGLIGTAESLEEKRSDRRKDEKMKIAWRYERLGEFGAGVAGSRDPPSQITAAGGESEAKPAFCHAFDLTKRLTHAGISNMSFIPLVPSKDSPFAAILNELRGALLSSPANTIHRIVMPTLLNPTLYPPSASQPEHVLQFFHSLKALMSAYPTRVTAMITIPLSLFPRSSGLIRWIELLCDGVIELCPFPHSADTVATSGAATSVEEPPQGMLKTHKLPVLHERGGGSDQNVGQDWAFTLSRRRFEIKPFSLPPAEGDTEAQDAAAPGGMPKKSDLEF